MNIPRKISPDNLKDTLVQVIFNSGVSPELILGSFNHLFSDLYSFKTTSPKKRDLKITGTEGIIFEPIEKGFFLDKSERIKLDISGNAIVFNTYQGYILWENYFPVIEETIVKLFSFGIIKEVTRIGIRYISQFDNVNLFDSLNLNLSLNIPNSSLESTQLRTELNENDFKIILTLINKINQIQGQHVSGLNASIIDIDVIQLPNALLDSNSTLAAINSGHIKQKETFFSLLKPEFLASLNPEY